MSEDTREKVSEDKELESPEALGDNQDEIIEDSEESDRSAEYFEDLKKRAKTKTDKTKSEKRMEELDGKAESISKSLFSPLAVFSPDHYDMPDIPDEQITGIVDENGDVVDVEVTPKVVKPWVCDYYHFPEKKARLAWHLLFAVFMFLTGIYTYLATQMDGSIFCTILAFLLFINFLFRYKDIAVYKWPMPKIPILSDINFGAVAAVLGENWRKSREDSKKEYDELVESEDAPEYIEAVRDYNGEYPSPATILTNWMNTIAEWDMDDLIENSDGKLDRFSVRMLLKDDAGAWSDVDLLDTISELTGSHPQQWIDALDNWMKADIEDDE